jgi:hypothetical protein
VRWLLLGQFWPLLNLKVFRRQLGKFWKLAWALTTIEKFSWPKQNCWNPWLPILHATRKHALQVWDTRDLEKEGVLTRLCLIRLFEMQLKWSIFKWASKSGQDILKFGYTNYITFFHRQVWNNFKTKKGYRNWAQKEIFYQAFLTGKRTFGFKATGLIPLMHNTIAIVSLSARSNGPKTRPSYSLSCILKALTKA